MALAQDSVPPAVPLLGRDSALHVHLAGTVSFPWEGLFGGLSLSLGGGSLIQGLPPCQPAQWAEVEAQQS